MTKLGNGSKVAIIGGGPAGSFFALYLLRYAAERGIRPDITIYQQRNFCELGPKGCKGCAGILSMSLLRNLGELGLKVPEEIIQSKVENYAVHSPYISISINNPEKGLTIASVYRGCGPRISHYDKPVSFDGWLLGEAEKRGARVEGKMVSRVFGGEEAAIEVEGQKLEHDLVVLASGVNSKPVQVDGVNYVPPRTQALAQDELYVGTAEVQALLGNSAHAFFLPHSGMVFGTLVPKGPFMSVSVLSSGKERPVSVMDFLNQDIVKSMLPERYERVCGCRSRAAVSAARNYYADRFVAVGDAAVTRLYKDGIGSSLLTARQAARTAVSHGISRQDFEHHYKPFCNSIERDNRWGRILFGINDKAKNSRNFFLAQHRLIGDEQNNARGPQPFTRAVWGMLTGNYRYRSMAWMALNPLSLSRLAMALATEGLRGLFRKEETTRPKRLHVGGRKVLILGSGFGGTYVLRRLVPSLNRNENVETTMISDENFFLFSPLLHEVAMGVIETRHVAYPIRRLNWRDRFNFVQATVQQIDLKERKVTTSGGTFDFDYLVMALGSVADTRHLDAVQKDGGNIFTLKTIYDSMVLRNHIIEVFEQASMEKNPERQRQLVTFIISGAGYTGIQLVTELRDFIHRSLIKFHRAIAPDNVRIVLVEAESKIMAELHTSLGAYAMRSLQRMGIEVRLRSQITRVWHDRVELNGNEIIPAGTLIWVTGVVANPQIAALPVNRDNIGRVVVNKHMEVPGVPGVYAVGDCAHFKTPDSGRPVPPRAHIAVRQAKVVAHNILAEIRGRDKRSYHYSNTAEIISLGASRAMLRFHGLRLYGFLARLVWVGAYLLLVTGNYNRIRIVQDWLLALIFGRDTTFLKLLKK
ncbi:MAG: FAD-dependent oxidoreductase [Chloroflexi bacterium]|nr:FAD-dependent oxidoreductase [Chloroflexota bacterium]